MAIEILRIKLGNEQPAAMGDDMGRPLVGYRDGLSTDQLWERGRGCWRLSPERALEAEFLVLAHAGLVVLVGTVQGLLKASDGRFIITGAPIPDHPLIGKEDPWQNKSLNPVTYGSWSGLLVGTRRAPEHFVPACAGGVCGHCARCQGHPTFADRAAFYEAYPQLAHGWTVEEHKFPAPLGSDVGWSTNRYLITVAHPDGPNHADSVQGPATVALAFSRKTGKIHVLGEGVGHAEAKRRWGHFVVDDRERGE